MLPVERQLHLLGEAVHIEGVPSVQTAEFAVAQGIDHDPAFNWQVKHVLKKRDLFEES